MPLFIYVDKIEDNIREIRKKTKKNIIAVLKSDAYAMKTSLMIPLLQNNQIHFFAFEKKEEYTANRSYLQDDAVLIMESLTEQQVIAIDNPNVRISIKHPLDAFFIKDIRVPTTIHIRIDSGMNRLGLRNMEEFKWVIDTLQTNPFITIEGIYTHFSSDVEESNYYQKQVNLFEKYLEFRKFDVIHANATKSLHKTLLGNYVRVGMALYGYHQPHLQLKPVLQLQVRPCNLFYPSKNQKIGYMQMASKEEVGVIPLGYHDVDLQRIGSIYHKTQRIPLLGKSCMNHTHFIANDKINYLTWLSIFPTNDIICSSDEYDWYRILISLQAMKRIYIRRRKHDIPKILKIKNQDSRTSRIRKRSSEVVGTRIIGHGRGYLFREFTFGNTRKSNDDI